MNTDSQHTNTPKLPTTTAAMYDLTEREWDVLIELTDDLPNAELAERLSLTVKSVENYKTVIGRKLGMAGRDVLNRYARRYTLELREWYQRITGKLPPPDFNYYTAISR